MTCPCCGEPARVLFTVPGCDERLCGRCADEWMIGYDAPETVLSDADLERLAAETWRRLAVVGIYEEEVGS